MRRQRNVCNYVHDAEIWKDHVRTEHSASKSWPNRWGFTKGKYQKLQSELSGRDQKLTGFSNQMDKYDQKLQQVVAKQKQKSSRVLPPISQALPPSVTVKAKLLAPKQEIYPKTTSNEVGWLYKRANMDWCNEKLPNLTKKPVIPEAYRNTNDFRARGKWTLYKHLGWPIQSIM